MITIQKATDQDVEAIYQLGQAVPEFAVSQATVTFWPLETIRTAVTASDVVVLVAKKDGQAVGFIIAACNRGLGKATIENILVEPAHRREQIGKMLLDALLKELVAQAYHYVATLVPVDAAEAAALYTEGGGFSKGETFVWLDKSLDARFIKLQSSLQ